MRYSFHDTVIHDTDSKEISINPLYTGNPKRLLWQTVKIQDLHCLLRLNQPLGTEIHHNLENSTYDAFKYTMDSPILIVSIFKGKSIRI